MDQLKTYLQKFQRNQFWILTAVLLLTAVGTWYWGTDDLDRKFVTDKQRNDGAFLSISAVKNDRRENSPPNTEYKKRVDEQRSRLEDQVVLAWRNLFDRQKPALVVHPRVGDMAPFLGDEKNYQKDIPPKLRETYHNNQVIDDDFRDLFAMLNLRRAVGTNPVDDTTIGRGPANTSAAFEGLVVWNATPTPRNLMLRYKTTKTPSTVRVRMTQEDLWVFRSMFGVIANINQRPIDDWLQILNGGTPGPGNVDQANVPIKQIDFCDLAQYAMNVAHGRPGYVKIITPTAEGGEEEKNDGGVALGGAATGAGGFSVGTQGTEEEDKKLLEGRYIDGRNLPVPDPKAPPFSEFKQVFVQMTLLMDQRLVPVLISECSNAVLTIETRQVLIDLNQVDITRATDAGQAVRQMNKVEQSPNDALVTIRGVVYGYSPPDKTNLGKGSDADPSKREYGIPVKPKQEGFF